MIKGIDISKYQTNVDFNKVKNDGIEFVIIRCGYTGYGDAKSKVKDPKFEEHYTNAKKAGLKVGVYYYSCAETPLEAIEEAKLTLSLVKGKEIDYPIFYDVEESRKLGELSKQAITDIVKAYCDYIEKAGYYVSIYANLHWLNNKMDLSQLTQYDKWVAQWANKCTFKEPYGMWQYSNCGKVTGISGNVDMNYAYKDYANIIKNAGLNGFKKQSVAQPQPKPTYKTYTIKKGDSWWRIAEQQMGSGLKCTQLAKYNGKTILSVIHPGDVIKIPT